MQVKNSTPVVSLAFVDAVHAALGLARSLGRLGVPVHVVAPTGYYRPVFFSKFCAGRFLSRPTPSPEQFLREMSQAGRRIGQRSVLIPMGEEMANLVAENADRLRETFIFPDQDTRLIRQVSNKRELHHLAKTHDVPTAEIHSPRNREDLLAALDSMNFPVLFKPIQGRGGTGQVLAMSEPEAVDIYNKLTHPKDVILQEYIPGGVDTNWMFEGYFDSNSNCLFGLTGRSLRIWPPRTGITTLGVCLKNKAIEETCKRFVKEIGYTGIMATDWRYDSRDGEYKLLDFNPRVGSEFRLFVSDTEMDVVRALYLDMVGERVDSGEIRDGRKWLTENLDLQASLESLLEGSTFRRLLSSFRGVQETGCFAADDPSPTLRIFLHVCLHTLIEGRRWLRDPDHRLPRRMR